MVRVTFAMLAVLTLAACSGSSNKAADAPAATPAQAAHPQPPPPTLHPAPPTLPPTDNG